MTITERTKANERTAADAQADTGKSIPGDAETNAGPESDATMLTPEERLRLAERIIQDHVLLGVASGFIPGPALDVAAAFADQLAMIKRLSTLYGVPFRENVAKSLLSSLMTSLGGVGVGAIAAMSFFKIIPGIGTLAGVAGTSVSLGALTYGTGKVFQQHFASGGTLIDLNPRAYRDYFREMTRRGRAVAGEKLRGARSAAGTASPGSSTSAGVAAGT